MKECCMDYKKEHCWERVGVYAQKNEGVFILFQCSQCKKCIRAKVVWLDGGSAVG